MRIDQETVSATELARHTHEVLGRVRRGEIVTVTFGSWPVARIVPLSAADGGDAAEDQVVAHEH
jgi:prevent-host-death family protein